MGKVDWGNLEVVEVWSPINPGDADALTEEDGKLDLLVDLIFKVYRREKLERSEQKERERQRIRKKVGLEP